MRPASTRITGRAWQTRRGRPTYTRSMASRGPTIRRPHGRCNQRSAGPAALAGPSNGQPTRRWLTLPAHDAGRASREPASREPRQRSPNRASNQVPPAAHAQIIGNFQLSALGARTAVADVRRMPAGIPCTRRFDLESRRRQLLRESARQFLVQPADVNARFAETAVHAQHESAARGELETARMIESVARDVQRPVLAPGFQSLEDEQVTVVPGNRSGDLGGTRLDQSSMRRDDENGRRRPLEHLDSIILARCLMTRELGEGTVFASGSGAGFRHDQTRRGARRYNPNASMVRYAHTDGARNQGLPR